MTTLLLPREITVTATRPDDDLEHWVCHCTSWNISGCGMDVSREEWAVDDLDEVCPLCELAYPEGSVCPWGCSCEECWGAA